MLLKKLKQKIYCLIKSCLLVAPVQGLVAAATVHLVFMFAAAANLVMDKLAEVTNLIPKVMTCIAKTCKQCIQYTYMYMLPQYVFVATWDLVKIKKYTHVRCIL